MAKSLFKTARGDLFRFPATDLVLIDDPTHPLYDERVHMDVDESLVRNIMVHGVIEPVVVAKIDGKPVVVDGRQRVKAAKAASERLEREGGKPVLVPCVVRRGGEGVLFGVSVSANELRTDDTPLAKAEKLVRLLSLGYTEEEAGVVFGVSPRTIDNWLRLTELDPAVKYAVDEGQISATAAGELSGLPKTEQKAALKKLLAASPGQRPSRSKTKKATKRNGYRFRSKKEILESVPESRRDEVRPYISGPPANRIALCVAELRKIPDLKSNPAFVALLNLIGE
jgi:ParB family chromosome partitioning protein